MSEHATFTARVAAYFKAHPGEWLDGDSFRNIGGKYAYRTRISDCRVDLGMRIENRKRRVGGGPVISEYRYLPDAPDHVSATHDLNAWGLR